MSDLRDQFEVFLERISLAQTQNDRMESAVKGLTDYLTDQYAIRNADIFVQGSFANGTVIRPLAGDEYDVDLVAICVSGSDTENEVLENLERVLGDHGRYTDRITRKEVCIRLQYADETVGGFHVDVVPARLSIVAPLEVPRRDNGWHGSAPAEYVAWCLAQGESFVRTIKALKRWRDDQPGIRDAITSILLQVLVAPHIPVATSDGVRLAAVLEGLHLYLASVQGVPTVLNPALPTEDLASRWSIDECNLFRQHLAAACSTASRAANAADDVEAAGYWRELLGEDFPLPDKTAAGIELGDISHARTPVSKEWRVSMEEGLSVTLKTEVFDGRHKLATHYRSDGEVLKSGWEIRFTAEVRPEDPGEIWWQVINTGGHARQEEGLRGNFFKARARGSSEQSGDQRVNWEKTLYTGSHLIEAFVVRNNTVVARSGRLAVNIVNPRRQFFR